MTYTKYCLTDAMLKRLSAIVNNSMRGCTGGLSASALERRGLVTPNPERLNGDLEARYWIPTDQGRWALTEARKEGW